MPKGVYKRSKKELDRIRSLRRGKKPWNKGKSWSQSTKDLISKKKKERDKITKEAYLNWLIGNKQGPIPVMPGRKRLCNGNAYHRVLNHNGIEYPEHRLMIELVIGRKLRKGEIVHHIDGDIQNNFYENLCLFCEEKHHGAYHIYAKKHGLSVKSILSYMKSVNIKPIYTVIGQVKPLLIVRENLTS